MSLINQMLKDLAQRQAPSNYVPGPINPVNFVPQRKALPNWVWISLLVIINLLIVAGYWWQPTMHTILHKAHPQVTASRQVVSLTPSPAVASPPAIPSANPVNSANTGNTGVPALTLSPALNPAYLLASSPAPVNAIASANTNPATPASQPGATSTATAAATETPAKPAAMTIPMPASAKTELLSAAISANSSAAPAIHANTGNVNKQVKPLTSAQIADNEYMKAANLVQQGDTEAGISILKHLLQTNPEQHQARLMLVGLLIENKQNSQAEQLLQQGLDENPRQTDFAMLLARLQVDHASISDSIATLQRSLPYAANQADYQAFLAALLQRTGKQEQAIAHYVLALRLNPQSGVWWMGLGISEKALKQTNEARDAFSRAKATNSLSPDLEAFVDQQIQ